MANIIDILRSNFSGCKYSASEEFPTTEDLENLGTFLLIENPTNDQCIAASYPFLVWDEDNTVAKPTLEEILALSNATDLQIAKNIKEAAINAQRDANKDMPVLGECSGKKYYFQRSISAHLAFVNTIQNSEAIAITDWVTEDNAIVDVTCGELRNICAHLRVRDTTEHVQARKRKDALGLLTSLADVENYDITQVYVD